MPSIEQTLDARMARRLAAEDRYLTRLEDRLAKAEPMVGELCRDGFVVFYVNRRDRDGNLTGKTAEFPSFGDAIDYLLRNNYA